MAHKAKKCRKIEKVTFWAKIQKLTKTIGRKSLFWSMNHYSIILIVLAFQNRLIYACRCSRREIMVNSVVKFSFFHEKNICGKSRFSIIPHPIYLTIFSHLMIHKGQVRPLWIAEMLQFMK